MLIFDIETDGLLDTMTTIHCMTILDTDTMKFMSYRPNEIQQGIERLHQADTQIVGHNVISFDIPAMEKVSGLTFRHENVLDTLVLTRLVYSNLNDIDAMLIRKGVLPSKLFGKHSLKAWGYRIGENKGTYAEETEDAWAVFNEEMLDYNKLDVKVTYVLLKRLLDKGFTDHACVIEHKAQWLTSQMERNGYPFDIEKAKQLEHTLRTELDDVVGQLKEIVPPIPDRVFIPKRDNKRLGYIAGVPIQRYKEFKVNSRQQIKWVLHDHLGYEFTNDQMYQIETDSDGKEIDRKLKLDEETLKLIINDKNASEDVVKVATLYNHALMLSKRLGQLADGQNAWLKLVNPVDGKMHGKINPNGTVSGRATHSSPNISQVPSISSPYGKECRELFNSGDWWQAGVDCSGLELRCLAHFMYPFDKGEYAHEILNGDIHTANQKNAGLETRQQAKRFIYAFLYGGGNALIGEIVGGNEEDGKELKDKFLKNTPAIKKLSNKIKDTLAPFNPKQGKRTWKRKYLVGLDGRKLHVRSLHSALNLLLQSAGALICKRWITRTDERLQKLGYKHGWNGDYVIMSWSHDEIQVACRTKEIAEVVVEQAQLAVRDVQQEFKFRIQLDTEGKIGKNWADCH